MTNSSDKLKTGSPPIRQSAYLAIVPGAIAFVIYMITACRSVYIGDAGEFALALDSLGICHPPGYPLFTILGRIFVAALTFLRPVFAAGIFNIIVASAAVSFVYLIFRRTLGAQSAFALSMIWAFTPVFWAETVGIEIYALNVLLVAAAYLSLESKHPRKWYIAIYLFGLSLTNHPSALSLAPAILYLFVAEKAYRKTRQIPVLILLLAIAGTVYLYLPIRSALDPISNWGNPETTEALVDHMTLEQYSGWVSQSFEGIYIAISLYFRTIIESWWWPGLILAVIGGVFGIHRGSKRTVMALLILVTALFLSSSHQALNYDPFYLIPLFATLLLISENIELLRVRSSSPILNIVTATGVSFLAAVLLLTNLKSMDKSDYKLAEEYGKLLLDTAGDGDLLTAGDINSFPAVYLRYSEGYRTTVDVYDRSIRKHALMRKAEEVTNYLYDDYYTARNAYLSTAWYPVYLSKSHYLTLEGWYETPTGLFTYGILYAVSSLLDEPPEVPVYPIEYDPGDPLSRQLLANLDLARGEQILASNPEDSSEARRSLERALLRFEHDPRALPLNEIGMFFRRSGEHGLALRAYEDALEKPVLFPSTKRDIKFNISNVYKDLGNAAHQSNNFERALQMYTRALEYDEGNPQLLMNIGLIYLQNLGNPEAAREYLNRYLELRPDDNGVRNLLPQGSLKKSVPLEKLSSRGIPRRRNDAAIS